MRIVFDIETDGLLNELSKIHCLVVQDIDSGRIYKYANEDSKHMSIDDGLRLLSGATVLIGHNIIGFDLRALKKVYNWQPKDSQAIVDTWIMSMVLNYNRPHKQGLGGWGEYLGFAKQDNTDFQADGWKKYNSKMLEYCVNDVKLNTKVFNVLNKELNQIAENNPLIRKGLRIEHKVAEFNAMVNEKGFLFDIEKANRNLKFMQRHMSKIEKIVEPRLGDMIVYIDKLPKTPKYTKKGWYTATTARLLSEYFHKTVLPEDAINNAPIYPNQSFQRSEKVKVKMGNMEQVKEWLKTIGWKPDDYNVKKLNGQWIRTGPKLTSSSLKLLGGIGKLIDRYYTIKNRKSVIEGWIDRLDGNRLHGNMWTIGTPSFRCRHEVIVNLPATDAPYGRLLRELFICEPDKIIVGADSAGNQLRGLCHYVGDAEYTDIVVNGDQHQRNADILECSRPVAKSFLYAILFGAGDAKLGQTLRGTSSAQIGKAARNAFMKALPGFGKLVNDLTNVFGQYGCIPGLDGRTVYVRSDYQCLNYLLQSAEGITCKAAVAYAMDKIKSEGLKAYPILFYHDEQAWVVDHCDATRVGEILTESFREAPKEFGVECMDGGIHMVGKSYAEVH